MDAEGHERWRLEGYYPKDEFQAQLMMGLARVATMQKKWDEAERWYAQIVERFGSTKVAPEALYWRDVAKYNQTHDYVPLQSVAKELRERYPDSEWTVKASVWAA